MSVVKKTLTVVGVLIVVAIVGFLALGAISSVSLGSIDYSVEVSDNYEGQGAWDYPSEGMTYAVVEYTITNEGSSSGISNNPFNFYLSVNGVQYTYAMETYDVPGYATIEVQEGHSYSGTLIFEVPKGTTADQCELIWDSMPALDVKKV